MVKIKEVAEAAGVSTATVSRVLADKPHVRPEVRNHVLEVVKTLGYRPNRVAQQLRANTSRIIALVIPDIENPFFQRVSRAVEDNAQQRGYTVILCNTDENPDRERRCLEMLRDENIAGMILAPTRQSLKNLAEVAATMPMVLIDRQVAAFQGDSVRIDNLEAARLLTGHLLDHGYRRIGGIFGSDSTTGRERRQGYAQAFDERGLPMETDLLLTAQPREDHGNQAAGRLLDHVPPPEAMVTSNSMLAAGAIRAIRQRGLKIPEDIAFATIDDAPWTRLLVPPLTVIEQPTYDIGRTAAELLIKRITEPDRSFREVTLASKLVVRQSCGCRFQVGEDVEVRDNQQGLAGNR